MKSVFAEERNRTVTEDEVNLLHQKLMRVLETPPYKNYYLRPNKKKG
jgi:hypothetical protein